MADIDLKLKSTYAGKSQTLTLSDANPEASDSVLLEFGQRINALTDNTYASTDKVTTINLDTESGAGKPIPTLTLSKTTDTLANVKAAAATGYGYGFTFTTTGDGVPYAYIDTNSTAPNTYAAIAPVIRNNATVYLLSTTDQLINANTAFDVKVVLPETDNYQRVEATFTVTN